MTRRSLKDEKRKQEKAKTGQSHCHTKEVETDYKQGEDVKEKQKFITLLRRPKRVRPADEENFLDDRVEGDSNEKRKKRMKEKDVKTSQLNDSVEFKHQREGKVKEKRGKSHERQIELAGTVNSVDSACEERTNLDSGEEMKELGESNRDEKEHFKHKHNKKAKKTKVDVVEKRKKRKHDKMNFSEGDLQNISDADNSDVEVDKKKKKKKRSKKVEPDNTHDTESNELFGNPILGTSEELGTEETDAVKKKKKKKSKCQPGQESKSKTTIHPGVDYLRTWHNDRRNWNFKKVRQVWLLQNMFDHEQVSKIMQ